MLKRQVVSWEGWLSAQNVRNATFRRAHVDEHRSTSAARQGCANLEPTVDAAGRSVATGRMAALGRVDAQLHLLRNQRFADSPPEGTGFEPSVPLLRKALLGVANRRQRHERRSHLRVRAQDTNACP
jgi:hypothetical protein